MMQPANAIRLTMIALTAAAAVTPPLHARSVLARDVEGYAIATCFTRQSEPLLKNQGDAWASAIVQRGHGEIDQFTTVSRAVDAELKVNPKAIGHSEMTGKDFEMPLLHCSEIIDTARVRAAIDRAEARLTVDYKRR